MGTFRTKYLGLVVGFESYRTGKERRAHRSTLNLTASGGYACIVKDQLLAYICQLNQSPGGAHPVVVISLFTMNWSLR